MFKDYLLLLPWLLMIAIQALANEKDYNVIYFNLNKKPEVVDDEILNPKSIPKTLLSKDDVPPKAKSPGFWTALKRKHDLDLRNQISGTSQRLPAIESQQYNYQDPVAGTYKFGYRTDDQYRHEERKPDGSTIGNYGWKDQNGNWHRTFFVADKNGYRTVPSEQDQLGPMVRPAQDSLIGRPQVAYQLPDQQTFQDNYNFAVNKNEMQEINEANVQDSFVSVVPSASLRPTFQDNYNFAVNKNEMQEINEANVQDSFVSVVPSASLWPTFQDNYNFAVNKNEMQEINEANVQDSFVSVVPSASLQPTFQDNYNFAVNKNEMQKITEANLHDSFVNSMPPYPSGLSQGGWPGKIEKFSRPIIIPLGIHNFGQNVPTRYGMIQNNEPFQDSRNPISLIAHRNNYLTRNNQISATKRKTWNKHTGSLTSFIDPHQNFHNLIHTDNEILQRPNTFMNFNSEMSPSSHYISFLPNPTKTYQMEARPQLTNVIPLEPSKVTPENSIDYLLLSDEFESLNGRITSDPAYENIQKFHRNRPEDRTNATKPRPIINLLESEEVVEEPINNEIEDHSSVQSTTKTAEEDQDKDDVASIGEEDKSNPNSPSRPNIAVPNPFLFLNKLIQSILMSNGRRREPQEREWPKISSRTRFPVARYKSSLDHQ